MTVRPRHLDPQTLLCESCGYILDGLPHAPDSHLPAPPAPDAVCPECGTPVRESLPGSSRPGSPWQQDPRWRTLGQTAVETLLRPSRMFRIMSIGNAADIFTLASRYGAIASTLMAFAGFYVMGFRFWPIGNIQRMWLLLFGCFSMASMMVLAFLVWVEFCGIRFFGRQRGWRITRRVAAAVCAHACVGWVLGAFGMVAVSLVYTSNWAVSASPVARLLVTWRPLMLVLPFFAGLLTFETLVYIGVRRCRYANVG